MKVCSTLKFGLIVLLFASVAQAQSIDISKFYYRDYLDFGQGYGAFNGENSGKANTSNGTTLTGKDGTKVSVPNVPNFSASSNYGSLTSVGRGFAVTANHVSSPESVPELTKWGLSNYKIANQPISDTSGEIYGTSKPYGRDEKFLRFDKYVVEGQVDMLDIDNTTSQNDKDSEKEKQNLERLKTELDNFKHTDGNVYLYQAGSGIIKLRGTMDYQGQMNAAQNGETKGGGFGTLDYETIQYADLVKCQNCATGDNRGMVFNYKPDLNFNNRITSGDSGSGIYAFNQKTNQWVLLGVVSESYEHLGLNNAKISFASNKDLQDYQSKFEQTINLKMTEPNLNKWMLSNTTLEYGARGDTPKDSHTLQNNKDIIFKGGGTIEVQSGIYRNNSGYAGGFVFTADNSATSTNPTRYIFTNKDNKANIFAGSGLDIGQNVVVEWALRNKSNDSLHKIGKGELIVKTNYTPDTNKNENLGTLKIGEGKVTLDTTTKAFENIYITSGRGELALKQAEALGATKDNTNSASGATSYTLSQDKNSEMGFYFGKGGGKFDLAGNSLMLNTIAANDSKAIITNSSTSLVDLEIQGLGYADGKKTQNKADTIIHASIGDNTNGTPANLNLIYTGDKTPTTRHSERSEESTNTNSVDSSLSAKAQNDNTVSNTTQTTKALQGSGASLIFDGHINIKGELKAKDGNIVLQGHPTTHATISDDKIREQIKNAESGTSAAMPSYMDLSKPSNLQQPDWDSRNFTIGGGINLTNTTLTVGKAANLKANINADNTSQIYFGGRHFIDERDGKNIGGSGFSYYQLVKSGDLANETYKDSSYSGTIKANGTTITSQFFDFTPNLELSNNAKLDAKYLTLTQSSTMNFTDSSAKVENLIFKDFTNNNFASKFTLNGTSTFSVTQALSFDKSTFDLDTLKTTTTTNNLKLPTEYNLYAFNGSTITANDFQNTNANAEFVLDNKSTFTATNAVSFKSAKIGVQNEAEFKADSLTLGEKSTIDLDKGKLTLTGDLQTQSLNLNLLNSSTLNAKTLTSNGASTINLNDKAELTLTDTFTSENLTLTLENESKFTANTLTASGVVKLQGDKNATLALETLNLDGVSTANLNGVTSTINTLNLTQTSQANIGENVSITTLTLQESTANLQNLNTNLPQSITLNKKSTLQLNELNLNEFKANLTSDETSQAHIKKLIYDAKTAQNGINTTPPKSNLIVSEKFELKNVGQNLSTTTGTTQGAQNAEKDKLEKDLFTLKFEKNLELKDGANLDISFADKVTKENLLFDKDYKIFSASTLTGSNLNINFTKSNGASFNETDFYATGKLDKENNAFFVQFVHENPRNFSKLNPYINPAHSPLLEILLQHNKNDESIDKAINMRDYSTLNQRLAQIDTSLKTIANADSAALKTLPLLQKQEINARIQQNRFTTAKFALAKITNPAQKSDIVPTLLYLDENERQNRVWSGASASFFGNGSDKFSLQSVSIGYDRKLFGDEFLLGILASLTNTQLSSDETSLNPKIYTLALYSDALFRHGELQNELSFSLLNGDKGFESENGSYKSFYGFFESVYKVQTAFLPQSIKPIVLGRVNLRHFDEFSTATYKQKADDDISVDLGVGVEWLWQKESGFYSASFVAERDIYHSQKERLMSLTGAQKFVAYETNEPSFAYQLYLAGLENFKNGIYLRYGLSGFVDSKAYKGFKADVQVGYRF
mgnify:FL=1